MREQTQDIAARGAEPPPGDPRRRVPLCQPRPNLNNGSSVRERAIALRSFSVSIPPRPHAEFHLDRKSVPGIREESSRGRRGDAPRPREKGVQLGADVSGSRELPFERRVSQHHFPVRRIIFSRLPSTPGGRRARRRWRSGAGGRDRRMASTTPTRRFGGTR